MIDTSPLVGGRTEVLVTIFRRLFENEFATLDGIAISARTPDGFDYLDESVALDRMLADVVEPAPFEPADGDAHALHAAMHAAWPDMESAVSGISRHLRALLLEDMALPAPTSMLRKRGVSDLGDHLVTPTALVGEPMAGTLREARARAERSGMAHVLLIAADGTVVVAAPTPIEAMAHWHNIEFAARVECMRLEEEVVHSPDV